MRCKTVESLTAPEVFLNMLSSKRTALIEDDSLNHLHEFGSRSLSRSSKEPEQGSTSFTPETSDLASKTTPVDMISSGPPRDPMLPYLTSSSAELSTLDLLAPLDGRSQDELEDSDTQEELVLGEPIESECCQLELEEDVRLVIEELIEKEYFEPQVQEEIRLDVAKFRSNFEEIRTNIINIGLGLEKIISNSDLVEAYCKLIKATSDVVTTDEHIEERQQCMDVIKGLLESVLSIVYEISNIEKGNLLNIDKILSYGYFTWEVEERIGSNIEHFRLFHENLRPTIEANIRSIVEKISSNEYNISGIQWNITVNIDGIMLINQESCVTFDFRSMGFGDIIEQSMYKKPDIEDIKDSLDHLRATGYLIRHLFEATKTSLATTGRKDNIERSREDIRSNFEKFTLALPQTLDSEDSIISDIEHSLSNGDFIWQTKEAVRSAIDKIRFINENLRPNLEDDLFDILEKIDLNGCVTSNIEEDIRYNMVKISLSKVSFDSDSEFMGVEDFMDEGESINSNSEVETNTEENYRKNSNIGNTGDDISSNSEHETNTKDNIKPSNEDLRSNSGDKMNDNKRSREDIKTIAKDNIRSNNADINNADINTGNNIKSSNECIKSGTEDKTNTKDNKTNREYIRPKSEDIRPNGEDTLMNSEEYIRSNIENIGSTLGELRTNIEENIRPNMEKIKTNIKRISASLDNKTSLQSFQVNSQGDVETSHSPSTDAINNFEISKETASTTLPASAGSTESPNLSSNSKDRTVLKLITPDAPLDTTSSDFRPVYRPPKSGKFKLLCQKFFWIGILSEKGDPQLFHNLVIRALVHLYTSKEDPPRDMLAPMAVKPEMWKDYEFERCLFHIFEVEKRTSKRQDLINYLKKVPYQLRALYVIYTYEGQNSNILFRVPEYHWIPPTIDQTREWVSLQLDKYVLQKSDLTIQKIDLLMNSLEKNIDEIELGDHRIKLKPIFEDIGKKIKTIREEIPLLFAFVNSWVSSKIEYIDTIKCFRIATNINVSPSLIRKHQKYSIERHKLESYHDLIRNTTIPASLPPIPNVHLILNDVSGSVVLFKFRAKANNYSHLLGLFSKHLANMSVKPHFEIFDDNVFDSSIVVFGTEYEFKGIILLNSSQTPIPYLGKKNESTELQIISPLIYCSSCSTQNHSRFSCPKLLCVFCKSREHIGQDCKLKPPPKAKKDKRPSTTA